MTPRAFSRAARAAMLPLLVFLGSAVGCTYVNKELNPANLPLEDRRPNHTRAALGAEWMSRELDCDRNPAIRPATGPTPPLPPPPPAAATADGPSGYFVGVAISGGGSRSANFSAAVMFQLQRVGFLRHVDYLSSVSGGSLTAAYYCLHDDRDWNPGNVQKLLTHPFATDLILTVVQPWNFVALLATDWDRSDILAAAFDRVLFSREGRTMTYADLRADRPRLLINATDLQSGRRFVFCNESFDEINSDLSKFPVGHAVAASAAVPVLMHHVTLRDFSTIFKQYRHFIDGGITDNLGIETLLEVYDAQNAAAERAGRPPPYPKGAVFVVIDAKTRFDARLSDKADLGFLKTLEMGAGLTSTALLGRASSATLADMIVRYSRDDLSADKLRQQIADLQKTGFLETTDRSQRPVRIVHFALSHVNELGKLPFQGFSESLDNIATYFNISPTDAYDLYQAAELLMKERFEPLLRPIVRELEGEEGVRRRKGKRVERARG